VELLEMAIAARASRLLQDDCSMGFEETKFFCPPRSNLGFAAEENDSASQKVILKLWDKLTS